MNTPATCNRDANGRPARASCVVSGVLWSCVCLVLIAACSSDRDAASGTSTPSPSIEPPKSATTDVQPDEAPPAPGEPWIVYQEFTGRRAEIFIVRPDGSGAHSLTADVPGGHQTNPDWSPDGQRLVFAQNNGMEEDLWTVSADGTGAELLLSCESPCLWLDDPSWSPDGQSIVYTRITSKSGARVGVDTLEVLHLDDNQVDVVLEAPPTDFYAGPRWSPDGGSIVVEVVHKSGPDVFSDVTGVTLSVVDLRVTPPSILPLTEPDLFAATADWSPTGDTIVYSALATPHAEAPDLFEIRTDGSGLARLTQLVAAGGSATEPSFSPNGTEIVFVAQLEPGGDSVMARVSPDGQDLGPATGDSYRVGSHPRLRPTR